MFSNFLCLFFSLLPLLHDTFLIFIHLKSIRTFLFQQTQAPRRRLFKVAYSDGVDEAHVAEYVIAGWIAEANDEPPCVAYSAVKLCYCGVVSDFSLFSVLSRCDLKKTHPVLFLPFLFLPSQL